MESKETRKNNIKVKISITKNTRFRPVVIIAIPSDPRKRPQNAAATIKFEEENEERTIFILTRNVRFFRLPS